jgi:protein-S-isoprenylcysteine O-methyltransferase Ste14
MLMVIRQLASIVVLPGVVAIVIPRWIAEQRHIALTAPHDLASLAAVICGVAILVAGTTLFAACLFYFWSRGRGTLAPWDPPRRFVVEGPYRFVRNPMISGVTFIVLGEACILRSPPLAAWAGVFALMNVVYIPLLEEPMLAARFGEPYRRYQQAVRRFLPRLAPWTPEAQHTASGPPNQVIAP